MKYISHRGNLIGPNLEKENSIEYILDSIEAGFDCEIDVWHVDGQFMLGHDYPKYPVDVEFLKNEKLWCHAKNLEALTCLLNNGIHCFWHENDKRTLTSKGYIWTYPGENLSLLSVSVVLTKELTIDLNNLYGVCGDYVKNWI